MYFYIEAKELLEERFTKEDKVVGKKMKQLIKHYEARYNSEMDDDLLSAYIAALVWYAFSQCQIGVPPKEE